MDRSSRTGKPALLLPSCLAVSTPQDPEEPPAAGSLGDHLSNERTLLSWIRLSLAIIALGFVVARFGLFIAQLFAMQTGQAVATGASVPIGVALILAGPVFAILALLRFLIVEQEIDTGRPRRHHALIYIILIALVATSVGLAIYLAVAASTLTHPISGM